MSRRLRKCIVIAVAVSLLICYASLRYTFQTPKAPFPVAAAPLHRQCVTDYPTASEILSAHAASSSPPDAAQISHDCRWRRTSDGVLGLVHRSACFSACSRSGGDTCEVASFTVSRADLHAVHSWTPPAANETEQNRFLGVCEVLQCDVGIGAAERHRAAWSVWREQSGNAISGREFFIPKPLDNSEAADSETLQHVHVLMLTSPQLLHSRSLPALDTWLRSLRVSLYFDSHGDGLEAHQRHHNNSTNEIAGSNDSPAILTRSQVEAALMPYTERASEVDAFWLTLTSPCRARLAINGAWKPLAMLTALTLPRKRRAHHFQRWYFMVDDDTFAFTGNLAVLLRHHSTARWDGHPTILGSKQNYRRKLTAPGDAVPHSSPGGMYSLDYLQGGAGILFSPRAFDILLQCMSKSNITNVDGGSGRYDQVMVEPLRGGRSETGYLMREFGDSWPAGDMRVAWLVAHCNDALGAAIKLTHESGFSHRTAELALGVDRRHWTAGSPITFHRVRDRGAFELLQSAVHRVSGSHASCASTITWGSLQHRFKEYYQALLESHRLLDKEVRDAFFDDDGFA